MPAKLVTHADADERGSETRLTDGEKRELTQLRRDKRRLELEVDILKRAAAYFTRENMSLGLIYPLVHELADDKIDVAVACRGRKTPSQY